VQWMLDQVAAAVRLLLAYASPATALHRFAGWWAAGAPSYTGGALTGMVAHQSLLCVLCTYYLILADYARASDLRPCVSLCARITHLYHQHTLLD
jgi:hypothetical protein